MAETFSTGKRDELVERHSLGFRRLARFGQSVGGTPNAKMLRLIRALFVCHQSRSAS